MNQKLDPESESKFSCDPDKSLLVEFSKLWADANDIWEEHETTPAFSGYVSADYRAVYESLSQLRGRALTFLEWGSGLGVATIMASQMGYDAYGIESESVLVDFSETLAQKYGPEARFAQGSFIPDDFEWIPAEGDEVNRTVTDLPAAYDELDMELRDFDLVYAYPWPNEHSLFRTIIRQYGRTDAMFLSYDAREEIELIHFPAR